MAFNLYSSWIMNIICSHQKLHRIAHKAHVFTQSLFSIDKITLTIPSHARIRGLWLTQLIWGSEDRRSFHSIDDGRSCTGTTVLRCYEKNHRSYESYLIAVHDCFVNAGDEGKEQYT